MALLVGLTSSPWARAGLGDNWRFGNPTPGNQTLRAVTHTGSQFVAVGAHGAVLVSSDATAWTTPAALATTAGLNAVAARGSSLIVAVGDQGTILTSSTGLGWTSQAAPISAGLRGLADSGTRFVAVGDQGTVMASTDGSTWTLRPSTTTKDLRAAGYGPGQFVAVGERGLIIASPDGLTWSAVASGSTSALCAVAWSGSQWVAVGEHGTILVSTNGLSWTSATSHSTLWLYDVAWDGAQFIVTADNGCTMTSANGTTWALHTNSNPASFYGVAKGGAKIVAVGDRGAIMTSSNGLVWTTTSSGFTPSINALASTGSLVVAVGNAGTIQTSPTGGSWTARTSGTTASLADVKWTGSQLIAVGSGGVVLTSPNGITWTARASGTTKNLNSVALLGSLLVAVGRDGAVITSTNGTAWAVRSIGNTTTQFRHVAASGTMAVAVAESGHIYTSSQGTTWKAATSGVTTDLEGVAWTGSQFVAVGGSGVVLTSATGSTWTRRALTGTTVDPAATMLCSAVWTGAEVAVLGASGNAHDPQGILLTSPDAVTWRSHSVGAVSALTSYAFGSTSPLLAGAGGAVLIGQPDVVPEVNVHPISDSVVESNATITVQVTLSRATVRAVSIPFTVDGTATEGAAADYSASASPLIIPMGATSGTITITVHDDVIDEDDETVILHLGTPSGAMVGSNDTYTLTIQDNDTKPAFSPPPPSLMVPLNSPVILTSNAVGDAPLTYQWRKGTVNLSGATSATYSIAHATATTVGSYSVVANNLSGTVPSPDIELGVVDTTAKTLLLLPTKTAIMAVSAAGNGLAYQWRKGATPLSDDGRITGSRTPTLTIRNLVHNAVSDDSGSYVCDVTGAAGMLSGGTNTLSVVIPPVMNALDLPTPLSVGQPVNVAVTAANNPTKFTITGLPAGLTYNASTGIISGRPTVAATYSNIRVTGTNLAGTGPYALGSITVQPLFTGSVGGWLGTVSRSAFVPDNGLGGRIAITTTAAGSLTGSLLLGATTYPFTTTLSTAAGAPISTSDVIIRRTGTPLPPPLHLVFTLDPVAAVIAGTVSDGTVTVPFNAWRAMAAPFTAYQGYYTSSLQLAQAADRGLETIPQGYGYSNFTIASNGVATGGIRLADNTLLTLSASLRANGTLVIYHLLYANTGTLLGTLRITPGNPSLVGSAGLDWSKAPQASTSVRSYRQGFAPLPLSVAGARYTGPGAGQIVLGLAATADNVSNAQLEFSQGGALDLSHRLNIHFRLTPPAVRDPQTPLSNPGKVTISVGYNNGGVTGTFSLSDMDTTVIPNKVITRTCSYYALISRDSSGTLHGFGCFQLAKMPDNTAVPATTISTSPILSGAVDLAPY